MSQYGLNTKINLDAGVNDLPIDVFVKIRDELDQNPQDKDWRALVRVAEDKYIIKQSDIERWSPAISNGSAADKLLTSLSTQGMVIRELRDYLKQLQIDTFKIGIDDYEDVVIHQEPPTDVDVYEGESLALEVQATGLPFPKYRWFFCRNGTDAFEPLQGRVESTLCLNNVSQSNAGTYSCQVYNCLDPKKTKITQNTLVAVSINPNPVETGLTSSDFVNGTCNTLITGLSLSSPKSPGFIPPMLIGQYYDAGMGMSYNLIMKHPCDVNVGMNESFVLSIEVQGDPPIAYQWYKNGNRLEGQNTPKIHVTHTVPSDFASYHCVVQNGIKTECSAMAHVTEKFQKQDSEIQLVSQPKSVLVNFGGCALFSCEAKCREPLRYQWFKDGAPLEDENCSELKLVNIQNRLVEGMYMCEISVKDSSIPRRLTDGAMLRVEVPSVRDNVEYHPSDKVALLIGNSEYKSENPLQGSTVDVQVLTETFRELNFKVVSLLNLTKPEIENAVLNFCELVDKNVYAVFYFCGHGFEENGLSYLMPTDAPSGYTPQHCVCAQHVLDNIQKKAPPFIWMIMDICRKPGKMRSNGIPLNMEKGNVKGNTVFCYATSEGMKAFENKHGGLLVYHLNKLLRKDIGIDALVSELKEEFHSMRKHSDIQIPELRSNLLEPRRSLVDVISTKGQTEVYQERHRRWINVWDKPGKQNIKITEHGILIELDFQAPFSNQLAIYVTVINQGRTDECIAEITNYSPSVSQYGQLNRFQRGRSQVAKTVLQDIQKLKDHLEVEVGIKMSIGGRVSYSCMRVNLGLPLVAKLKLWDQSNNFIPYSREGIEQSED